MDLRRKYNAARRLCGLSSIPFELWGTALQRKTKDYFEKKTVEYNLFYKKHGSSCRAGGSYDSPPNAPLKPPSASSQNDSQASSASSMEKCEEGDDKCRFYVYAETAEELRTQQSSNGFYVNVRNYIVKAMLKESTKIKTRLQKALKNNNGSALLKSYEFKNFVKNLNLKWQWKVVGVTRTNDGSKARQFAEIGAEALKEAQTVQYGKAFTAIETNAMYNGYYIEPAVDMLDLSLNSMKQNIELKLTLKKVQEQLAMVSTQADANSNKVKELEKKPSRGGKTPFSISANTQLLLLWHFDKAKEFRPLSTGLRINLDYELIKNRWWLGVHSLTNPIPYTDNVTKNSYQGLYGIGFQTGVLAADFLKLGLEFQMIYENVFNNNKDVSQIYYLVNAGIKFFPFPKAFPYWFLGPTFTAGARMKKASNEDPLTLGINFTTGLEFWF